MPKDASAIYANTAMITHTASSILPNDNRTRVQKRIVMTPIHAKLLMQALQDNLQKYETKHGEIEAPQRASLADQLFGAVKPEQEDDEDE